MSTVAAARARHSRPEPDVRAGEEARDEAAAAKPDRHREPADRWARERAFFMTVRPLPNRVAGRLG